MRVWVSAGERAAIRRQVTQQVSESNGEMVFLLCKKANAQEHWPTSCERR